MNSYYKIKCPENCSCIIQFFIKSSLKIHWPNKQYIVTGKNPSDLRIDVQM